MILPLQSEDILKNDSLFQDFTLLYHVLSDNESYINANNFGKAIELIRKTGLANAKVGEAVKRLIYDYANPRDVKKSIEQLKGIWGLKTNDIINECQNSPMKKEFIKGALEESGFALELVLENLKTFKFTDKERELFLSSSPKYKSAYSSYRRKKLFSGIFGKIFSLFSHKSKDIEAHQEETLRPTHSFQPKPTERPASDFGKKNPSTKALSEKDLDNVEKYLKNPNMPVSDVVKENREEVERRYFEAKRKGGIPPELRRFSPYFRTMLLLFYLSFFIPTTTYAASQSGYHDAYGDIKDAPKCYIVSPQTLNVRTSPSLYKGKRKKTKRKDNVGFKLSQGDTIFVSTLAQPTSPAASPHGLPPSSPTPIIIPISQNCMKQIIHD